MYWACLGISFVFSLSFIGAGFVMIAAAAVFVFRQFLNFKIKLWRALLLCIVPIFGQFMSVMIAAGNGL